MNCVVNPGQGRSVQFQEVDFQNTHSTRLGKIVTLQRRTGHVEVEYGAEGLLLTMFSETCKG